MKTIICSILVLLMIAAASMYGTGNRVVSSRASAIERIHQELLIVDGAAIERTNQQLMTVPGSHLLDISTGLPVVCDTDMDCYEKTGVDPYAEGR